MTTRTKAPRLLWSEQGQVGCELPGHAPYRGSDTWAWERWRPMRRAEAEAFERELGRPPACESCRAIALNAGTEGS